MPLGRFMLPLAVVACAIWTSVAAVNTSSYSLALVPYPPSLVFGLGYQNYLGMSNCFTLNPDPTNNLDALYPFQRLYSNQLRCGGFNFTAVRTDRLYDENYTSISNTTVATQTIYVEMLLVDPLQVNESYLDTLIHDAGALRSFVNAHVSWTPPNASIAGSWEQAYYNRTFSGPLARTNLVTPSKRFVSTSGAQFDYLEPRQAAIPMSAVLFLVVNETLYGNIPTNLVMGNITETRGSLYFASTRWNSSVANDITTELQVDAHPRMVLRVNYSAPFTISSAKTSPLVAGYTIAAVTSPSMSLSNDQQRRYVRTDGDWVPRVSGRTSVVALPPSFVVDGSQIDLFLDRNSIQAITAIPNVSWTDASLRVAKVTQVNNQSVMSLSSVRCIGYRWSRVYANATLLNDMFEPTVSLDGTVRTNTSGAFDTDNPCFPVIASVEPTPSANVSYTRISICPSIGTVLLGGYSLCYVEPTPTPVDVTVAMQAPNASTVVNTTSMVNTFVAEASSTGVVTNSNGTGTLVPSSYFSWSGNITNVALTPLRCWDNYAVTLMPLINASSPAATLRPQGGTIASGSATLAALYAQYRCNSISMTTTLLITATPLDGYCGVPWRVGLTAELLHEGLLLGFHNVAFSNRSTLYGRVNSGSIPLTSTLRCCVQQLGSGWTRSTCTSNASVTSTECWSNLTCASTTTTPSNDGSNPTVALSTVTRYENRTIGAKALRCSYDVYNVQRNCTPAVGAYLQLVLLPSTPFGLGLVANHTMLLEYVNTTATARSLTGMPLQLSNASGIVTFPLSGATSCFADSVLMAVMYPSQGASDGSSSISDGVVLSYYKGITSFTYSTNLYLVVRPTPLVCRAELRTAPLNGVLGIPLGPLDTDIQDSCGNLLSGSVTLRATPKAFAPTSASIVSVAAATLTSTLTGILQRTTNIQSNDPSLWRATFVGVTPVANVTSSNGGADLLLTLQMRSRSLAALGDTLLTTDVVDVPFLSELFLANCTNNAAEITSWMEAPNVTADEVAPMSSSACGTLSVPLSLTTPLAQQPVEIVVELVTFPTLVSTSALAGGGVWLNLTFSINNLNESIRVVSDFQNYIWFTSNLDSLRAPRGWQYSVGEAQSLVFNPVEIRESVVTDYKGQNVSTSAFVLPIFVQGAPLVNNLLKEVVTIQWSRDLFRLTSDGGANEPFLYEWSRQSIPFVIQPNGRGLINDAVMWLSFITMGGMVIRTSAITALYSASVVCFEDAGDRLPLTLHPLSFGIGSDETTQFLVGAVVGNTALIVCAFLAHWMVERAVFRVGANQERRAKINFEEPDSSKGLPTFPRWGLVATSLLYPGIVYSAARAVAIGLDTFLLYTVLLLAVLIGVSYPVALLTIMRYFSPRWQDSEAFAHKDVTVAAVPTGTHHRRGARARFLAAKESAKNAVADTQQAVQGLFVKVFTPTGFYEVNHVDHVRYLTSYQDYRGSGFYASTADAVHCVGYAIASVLDCPENLNAALVVSSLHLLFLLAYRPYVTIGRILANVFVDVGCIVGIAIISRGREQAGVLTLQSILILMSGLNLFGFIWAFVRSEGLRRFVRRRRRRSHKADRFEGRGETYVSGITSTLTSIEAYLYDLHASKPQVVYRRNVRKRRLLLEGNPELVIESNSGTPTDEEDESKTTIFELRSMSDGPVSATLSQASPLALQDMDVKSILKSSDKPSQHSVVINDDASPLGSPTSSKASGGRSFARTTSSAFRSTVSDDSSDDEKGGKIHLDGPEAMNASSAARRRNAQNRFKPYIKTETGKVFGRSDQDSVVKRLVVANDGVREMREWRDGTVQMTNEEHRKRKAFEEEFKNISHTLHGGAVSRDDRGGAAPDDHGLIKRWEEAFRYELVKRHGGEKSITGERETFLVRRQRALGAETPGSFDFERGTEVEL